VKQDRSYKRSWKNLLINKRYQLSFTLFMVGLVSLLMIGLGFFVIHVANETTKVSITSARGKRCPRIPSIPAPYDEEVQEPTMQLPSDTGSGGPAADPNRVKPKIDVDVGEMQMLDPSEVQPQRKPKMRTVIPPVPEKLGEAIVAKWTCELGITNTVGELERGRLRILYVLIATGFLLVIGLAAYGIKMTHKVAGPLFKVQLYLAKMRDGRFDKVYNLRKGDQLVDFYDHFKHAHGGIVTRERGDIDRLKSLIAAAESAGAGDNPSIQKLRDMVARKEKSLE